MSTASRSDYVGPHVCHFITSYHKNYVPTVHRYSFIVWVFHHHHLIKCGIAAQAPGNDCNVLRISSLFVLLNKNKNTFKL